MRHLRLSFVMIGLCGFLLWPSAFTRADQWFDYYGKIPWEEERLRLDDFAMFLKRNPDMIGYMAFYVGESDSEAEIERHVIQAKNHIVRGRLKINKERIVIVNAGKRAETRFVLQPVLKTLPPPDF